MDTCSNACLEPFNALTAVSIRYQVSPLSLAAQNYGNADYDIRHSINANYVYTVAPSISIIVCLKSALGSWTVAGTVFFHTGYPFSVVNSSVRGAGWGKECHRVLLPQAFLADYLAALPV